MTKLEVGNLRTMSKDEGHDDGDGDRGDTGQPGKEEGACGSSSNRGARANTNPQPIWSLFGSAYSIGTSFAFCIAQE